MYIFGGYVDCNPTSLLFKYDFNYKMWKKVVSIKYLFYERPCARTGHSAVTAQDYMYLFGGKDAGNKRLNDVWRFNF